MPKVSTFTVVTPVPAGTRVPVLIPSGPGYVQRLASTPDLFNANGGNVRISSSNKLQIQADDSMWYDLSAIRSQGFTVLEIGQTPNA